MSLSCSQILLSKCITPTLLKWDSCRNIHCGFVHSEALIPHGPGRELGNSYFLFLLLGCISWADSVLPVACSWVGEINGDEWLAC